MKKHIDKIVFIVFVAVIVFLFHRNQINSFPSHIHAWAQADRFALAHGFLRNGFDFFYPQTYILNLQFPHGFQKPGKTGITSVDFPIHDYLSAILMGVFQTKSPWCFRVYTLLYCIIGCFFLYKLSISFQNNRFLAGGVLFFMLTSPVFLYYMIGFLPTIPSIANFFIASWFYYKYIRSRQMKFYYWSIAFYTLAALSRTPFAIFLIAIICIEILFAIIYRKGDFRKTLAFFAAIVAIVGYYIYNQYLRQKYGSVFLGYILPPNNLAEFREFLDYAVHRWKFHYFTPIHYIFIILLVGIAVICSIKHKAVRNKQQLTLLLQIIVSLIGVMIYSVLMLRQFINHDYYFLDTFFPVIALIVVYLIGQIRLQKKEWRIAVYSVLVLFTCLSIVKAHNTMQQRRQVPHWDRVAITTDNFKGASEYLDSLGIKKSAKILVIDSYTPNIPFILMQRSGYAVMSTTKENIKQALQWNYDFIVIQDCFLLSDVVEAYPQIINEIKRIAGNRKISVYKKRVAAEPNTLHDFLNINPVDIQILEETDFESQVDSIWLYADSLQLSKDSTNRFAVLPSEQEFGITLKLNNKKCLTKQANSLLVELQVLAHKKPEHIHLVASVTDNGDRIYYRTYNLGNQIDTLSKWQHVHLLFPVLPVALSDNNELAVYFWNKKRKCIFIDNLSVTVY